MNLIECDGDNKCDGGKVCSLENPPYGKCVGTYLYIFMAFFFSGILFYIVQIPISTFSF